MRLSLDVFHLKYNNYDEVDNQKYEPGTWEETRLWVKSCHHQHACGFPGLGLCEIAAVRILEIRREPKMVSQGTGTLRGGQTEEMETDREGRQRYH